MTDNHPITPPAKLVIEWARMFGFHSDAEVFTKAAQWGADQELKACCEYMQHEDFHGFAKELRTARRPKRSSLKEQALAELAEWERICDIAPNSPIRLALEQLDD